MKKYTVELIGTFFLVLTVGNTVLANQPLAPAAIAAVLAAMIFAGGHVSGGHLNPAVTLAVWIRGKCPTADVLPYWIAQIAGAAAAALAVRFLRSGVLPETPLVAIGDKMAPAFLAELLFTFALCYTVLNVATATGTAGNSFYGLAIGLVVLAGAVSVGGLSGGAFNPAVVLGGTLMNIFRPQEIWIHLVAGCLGGVIAALAFRFTSGD